MVINLTSPGKKENEGQIGCEACIKKDEIIRDLYEALIAFVNVRPNRFEQGEKALAKAEGK